LAIEQILLNLISCLLLCQKRRQLAAILFTDIEGYTAVMQQSEEKAIALRDRHREVLQKAHAEFNGRVIQYYGDGTLSIFQSAVEAVRCALDMQQVFSNPPLVPSAWDCISAI